MKCKMTIQFSLQSKIVEQKTNLLLLCTTRFHCKENKNCQSSREMSVFAGNRKDRMFNNKDFTDLVYAIEKI